MYQITRLLFSLETIWGRAPLALAGPQSPVKGPMGPRGAHSIKKLIFYTRLKCLTYGALSRKKKVEPN